MIDRLDKARLHRVGTLDRCALEAYQVQRINEVMKRARACAPWYRDSLAGVAPLASLDDYARVPFVTAEELRHKSGKMLAISTTAVKKAFSHFTTGTLGRPKRICFSQYDVDRIVEHMAAITGCVMDGARLDPASTKVGIYLPNYGRPLSMAEMLAQGCALLGSESYLGTCEDIAEEQLAEVQRQRPHLIMGSCFRMWRMTQVGRETLGLGSLGVRAMLVTSEYMSEDQRHAMERAWGARVYHHYGMTEPGFAIGIECECASGFHYDESSMFFEVVDPQTGHRVPDGTEGELVYTSLDREAMPFIRYRTGDFGAIYHEPCACGGAAARIGKLPKRLGLVYNLGTGEQLYASLLDDKLYGIDDLLDYRLYLQPCGGLVVRAERIGSEPGFEQRVAACLRTVAPIAQGLRTGEFSTIDVEVAERASLRRGGRTLKRKIVDRRDPASAQEPEE